LFTPATGQERIPSRIIFLSRGHRKAARGCVYLILTLILYGKQEDEDSTE
jgi:hypothetical protein